MIFKLDRNIYFSRACATAWLWRRGCVCHANGLSGGAVDEKKYVLPVAKEVDKNLVSSFVPELANISFGETRPRKAVRDVSKRSAIKTIAKATGTRGATPGAGRVAAAVGRKGARNAGKGRAIGLPQLERNCQIR